MVVKNIIKIAIDLLGLRDLISYFEDGVDVSTLDDSITDEIESFVIAINMANNNIASNYIELVDTVSVSSNADTIPYTEITDKSIIEIKKVKNKNNVEVEYKVLPSGIKTDEKNFIIEFSYFPKMLNIDDEINYYTKVNELLFAHAVASEYLFLKGDIDDAYMWDRRFKQSMFGVLRPKKNIKIPARRWL